MPAVRFDVIFRGQILENQNESLVKKQVGKIFNATDSQIEQLFSGHPAVLKRGVDAETAGRFRLAFRNAGALIEIRPAKDLPGASTSATNSPPVNVTPTASVWTLSAPNNFSLEDCAVTLPPAPIPDVQHLTMATTGVPLDRTPPPAPIHIDTNYLSLIPGQSWSLADCDTSPLPVTLPDMHNISLDNLGVTLDETKPPAPVRINTRGIDLVTEQNWSLEDCQPPPPPPLNIDLSGLNLALVQHNS